ncbi:imidazoleglycerol-phosphate dehydratase HisB [candidate division KSB1 bacterium]|nr:imidazoleglycerol-phosphate dehydratase HisB [candidate division KSB1 bacterium]
MRRAKIDRQTRETTISIELNIDGAGDSDIQSGIGFFRHMLETFARHGCFDISARISGDVVVDQHHTVEDTGLVLGKAFKQALGEKKGINRAGFFFYPMDDALAMSAIDLSGRPYLIFDAPFQVQKVGEFDTELVQDFFQGFATSLKANLHIKLFYGRNAHHCIEAIFKSVARALKAACEIDPRNKDIVPSTKGVL